MGILYYVALQFSRWTWHLGTTSKSLFTNQGTFPNTGERRHYTFVVPTMKMSMCKIWSHPSRCRASSLGPCLLVVCKECYLHPEPLDEFCGHLFIILQIAENRDFVISDAESPTTLEMLNNKQKQWERRMSPFKKTQFCCFIKLVASL